MIELRGVTCAYPEREVLRDVNLTFTPGKVLALLGPNGCGKSTLLRTVLALQPKTAGEIIYDGTPVERLTPRQIALKAAYLPQSRSVPNITARKMVLHGRFPHLSYPRRYREEDYAAAERALEMTGAGELAHRMMGELSGGERQRIYLAMALAQETETILMDEPTTFLDIRHQLAVMTIAKELANTHGRAVAAVLHDLCLALRTADEVAVLRDGALLAFGTPEEVFLSGILDVAFGVKLKRFAAEDGWQYYYG